MRNADGAAYSHIEMGILLGCKFARGINRRPGFVDQHDRDRRRQAEPADERLGLAPGGAVADGVAFRRQDAG